MEGLTAVPGVKFGTCSLAALRYLLVIGLKEHLSNATLLLAHKSIKKDNQAPFIDYRDCSFIVSPELGRIRYERK